MFKVESVILTAALFGYASAADCYALYVSGGSYSTNDWVSASVTETETCATGTTGCVNGFKTVTKRYNFKCTSEHWCSQSGFAPGGQYSSSGWDKDSAECTVSATPATVAPPATWSGLGCPALYSGGTDYSEGDVVTVKKRDYSLVYECNAAPNDQFCGMAGYEPGDSLYWAQAWTEKGSCTGTLAPTDSPSFVALADAGGCPKEYETGGEAYEEGDRVSKDGFVFQCKSWPSSAHCSQEGYEPDLTAEPAYWKDAWMVVGHCSGTISPTSSPSFDVLENVGACPEAWSGTTYEEGDRVVSGSLVFQCKAYPYSGHCGQAGYEPNTDPASPGAWKDAWTVVGYCDGSMGPTSSPSFDPATSMERCPEQWVAGSNIAYDEGDMVSVVVSVDPPRSVVFKCKAWPYSGHCGQYSPDNELGGKLGWTYVGGCGAGSLSPTSSPSFDSLSITGACPEEWGTTALAFEPGDLTSVAVSDTPSRKIVYKCKPWPADGWCNQAGYKPGDSSGYWKMAWDLMGACQGTMAPTGAPVAYAGTCIYNKCVDDTETCTQGTTGCTCSGTTCTKVVRVCDANTAVAPWSNSIDYVTGDVVRLGAQRFKCRSWPNYLWCRQEAYKPTAEVGIWSDAWYKDGTCP